ncbi:hypothetical protein TWF696_001051 [Orbilia brochopaga]|uniref:Uncharacterized protein n=1 Tax=Orbilia brochopaga TaxID=3140254 RepID=A0AAV9VFV1_9PEZI
MADYFDFDDGGFWDEVYGFDEDGDMATLADDLAESTVPDINWSIFDDYPTSGDLQPFDHESDWVLFEFDHDEYYDINRPSSSSVRPKSSSSSLLQTPYPEATMDDEASSVTPQEQQQQHPPQPEQFHHDPVAVSAKGAADIAPAGSDALATDDNDDALDGGLRKKRPDIQLSAQQLSDASKTGSQSRSQSNERSAASSRGGSRSRRSRTPIPNPNTGPQPGEELEVIYEDDEKKVVIVHTGGITGKLRVIRKDTCSLQIPSSINGHAPSPLRNAESASAADTATLVVPAPSPK